MKPRRLAAFIAIAVIGAAASVGATCGDGDELTSARTIDVNTLAFEDIQERTVAAVQREGDVYYLVANSTSPNGTYTQDIWLALPGMARSEARDGETIELLYNGRTARVFDERFFDGPCDPCHPQVAATLAPHLEFILTEQYEDRRIDEGEYEGQPTIEVTVVRAAGAETEGNDRATIHLDESFQPLAMTIDRPASLPTTDVTFEHEFVRRDTIPADFFSPESLRALAGGPTTDLNQAVSEGLDVLWLGESFEDMILRDETDFYVEGDDSDSADAFLNISYGPADPMDPAPCVRISVTRASRATPAPAGARAYGTMDVGSQRANLYRAERAISAPPTEPDAASGSEPAFPPSNTVIPVATASAGNDVPADTGTLYVATIVEGDSAIEVAANCGPVGSNPYRTQEAFERLVASLRRYEPATASP